MTLLDPLLPSYETCPFQLCFQSTSATWHDELLPRPNKNIFTARPRETVTQYLRQTQRHVISK